MNVTKRVAALVTGLAFGVVSGVGCGSEKTDWKEAQATNTSQAYESFLSNYPDGEFHEQAESRVEAIAFNQAESEGTIEALESYLRQFPDGEFRKQASSRVEAIAFDQAESEGTIEAFEAWLAQYPESSLASQAQTQIKALEYQVAETAFSEAQDQNTAEAYQAFLARFPEGEFAGQARKMLNRIYPSFSSEKCLDLSGISESVAEGSILFQRQADMRAIEARFDGKLRVEFIDGKVCMFCAETVRLTAGTNVPTGLFAARGMDDYVGFISGGGSISMHRGAKTVTSLTPEGKRRQMNVAGEVESLDIALESITVPASEMVGDLIVGGPSGATLKKEGGGFRLIKGEAHLLRRRR